MLDPGLLAMIAWKRRKTARYHLQIELDRLTLEETLSSTKLGWNSERVDVEGRIVRTFRAGLRRRLGKDISFRIHIHGPRAMIFVGPPSIERKALLFATHIEVYLNEEYGELIAYEFKLLEDGPTAKPVMTLKEVEDRLAKWENRADLPPNKWWEFWKDRPSVRHYRERARQRQRSPRIKPGTILGLEPLPRHRLR